MSATARRDVARTNAARGTAALHLSPSASFVVELDGDLVLPSSSATTLVLHSLSKVLFDVSLVLSSWDLLENSSKLDRVKPHNMGMVLKTTTKALNGLFLGKLMVLWTQARNWLKSTPRLRISTQECTLWRIMGKGKLMVLKQLLQGQADGVVDTSKKLAEINSKIENLNTRVYSLENHASSVVVATKQGQLPGKAIQNSKEQCKVIFTQEGLDEEEDQERVMEEFCLLLNDDEIVAAEARGVQIDQPKVQLLMPFTLHQLSSHNKLDRQLDRVEL
ncbi:unnamed protein product [Microthlaspi erraticum]|uniref:Uncharacterized protein n=1 Tax=Microthlaspi erraticum TaxID=1685480 RepID=A0A6D2HVU0_9BRAS|nr:unnamed protein product [Microthlaspi erraticum]